MATIQDGAASQQQAGQQLERTQQALADAERQAQMLEDTNNQLAAQLQGFEELKQADVSCFNWMAAFALYFS